MSTADLLRKLGVYVIEDFFSVTESMSLCQEMLSSEMTKAATYSQKHNREQVNDRVRETRYCDISDESQVAVTKRVKRLKPRLERFFNTTLSDAFEHPKYLHYSKGDFFSPHTDDQLDRKINITINLNSKGSSPTDLGYEGGELQLYGLIKHEKFANRGISAPTTTGFLIAYPVDIVHEVTPITYGSRFSIVSRFLAG
ncbi:MAG: putative 2-oxoglutarate/Fe(II)-dependent dioxygenase YbiX [Chitinophagales bacterium]|jgi:predicted 2-oxoglutarate/Fe(II)-dependent dioxygenase YbiX